MAAVAIAHLLVNPPIGGIPTREIEAEDIPRANRLMFAASGLCLVLVTVCLVAAALVMR
jgi:cobalamin biosynthesis protein CobD/CbiB